MSPKGRNRGSFHHSLESGFGLNIFPKEHKMFSDSKAESISLVGKALAQRLQFSEDFQQLAALGAVGMWMGAPVRGSIYRKNINMEAVIPDYLNLYPHLYQELYEEWKKLWCATHRNKEAVLSGNWSVQERLLARYVSLSEIFFGLSELNFFYGLVVDGPEGDEFTEKVPVATQGVVRLSEKKAWGRIEKFSAMFPSVPEEVFSRWEVYRSRKDWDTPATNLVAPKTKV